MNQDLGKDGGNTFSPLFTIPSYNFFALADVRPVVLVVLVFAKAREASAVSDFVLLFFLVVFVREFKDFLAVVCFRFTAIVELVVPFFLFRVFVNLKNTSTVTPTSCICECSS